MPRLLEQVKGKGLCVSLLFDPSTAVSDNEAFTPLSKKDMEVKIMELRETLTVTEEEARDIEVKPKLRETHQNGLRLVS